MVKREATETDIVSGAANQRESRSLVKLPPLRRERIYLAVHRFDDAVYYRRVEKETFFLLSALRSGASVSDAVMKAFEKSRLTQEEQEELLRISFAHASELGWLCRRQGEESPVLVM